MRRHLYPAKPTSSVYLERKFDMRDYERHQEKVRTAKSVIDCKPPKSYWHIHLNLKKLQKEQWRLAEMQKENRIMIDKIACIKREKHTDFNTNRYEHRSLNFGKRQQDAIRIGYENIALLRNMMSVNGVYDRLKWEADFRLHLKYLENQAKFPRNWKELLAHEEKDRLAFRQELRLKSERRERYEELTNPLRNVLKAALLCEKARRKEAEKKQEEKAQIYSSDYEEESDDEHGLSELMSSLMDEPEEGEVQEEDETVTQDKNTSEDATAVESSSSTDQKSE